MVVVAAMFAVACGEGNPPPPGSGFDAGVGMDSGTFDAGFDAGNQMDSGTDSGTDAGTDAGTDSGTDGGVQLGCTVGEPETRGLAQASAVGLTTEGAETWLGWSENRAGFQNAYAYRVGDVAEVPVTDDSSLVEGAAIARVGSDALLAYRSNAPGTFELYAGTVNGTPHRVTNNVAREDSLAMVSTGTGALLSWIEDTSTRTDPGARLIRTQLLDASGQPVGSTNTITEAVQSPGEPAVGRHDDVFAVAYAEGGRALVQILSATGGAVGVPVAVSVEGWVSGRVSVVGTDTGSVVAYTTVIAGVREEVRYRVLDDEGMPVGGPVQVTTRSEMGNAPSAVPFAGGYVVAYRTSGIGAESTVRVKFFDANNEAVGTLDAGTGAATGPAVLLGAVDANTVAVAFPDTDTGVETVRVTCL